MVEVEVVLILLSQQKYLWQPHILVYRLQFCAQTLKIEWIIDEVGQKDKLGYLSLMLKVEMGLGEGYSDKEIVTAVIRAVQPGLQLQSYLESVGDLTLIMLLQKDPLLSFP